MSAFVEARLGWGTYYGTTHRLVAQIGPAPTGLEGLADLSVVTGGSFRVVSATRGTLTWAGTLLATPTKSLVVLGHAYMSGDLTIEERLTVTAVLSIPGDVVDCVPFTISVIS